MRLLPYHPTILLLTCCCCYTTLFHRHAAVVLAQSQSILQSKTPPHASRRLGTPRQLDNVNDENSNNTAAEAVVTGGGNDGKVSSAADAGTAAADTTGNADAEKKNKKLTTELDDQTQPKDQQAADANANAAGDEGTTDGADGVNEDAKEPKANEEESEKSDDKEQEPSQPTDEKSNDSANKTVDAQPLNKPTTEDGDGIDLEDFALVFVAVLLIGGIGLLVKKRMMKNSSASFGGMRFGGSGGVSDDDFTYGVSTVGGGGKGGGGVFQNRHEAVPLAATVNNNDDEWGWEDGNAQGEIELGNTTTTMKETDAADDLQTTLALSLSDNVGRAIKRSSSSSSSKSKDGGNGSGGGGRKSLPMSRRGGGGSGSGTGSNRLHRKQQMKNSSRLCTPTAGNKSNVGGATDSWGDDSEWGDDSLPTPSPIIKKSVSSPLSSSKPGAPPIMNEIEAMLAEQSAGKNMITSLGKKKTATPAKSSNRRAKEEEDIFASMGLSSMGRSSGSQFPAAVASSVSSNPVMSTSTWRNPTPATLHTAGVGDEDDDANGSDWDDDLDDLLDD